MFNEQPHVGNPNPHHDPNSFARTAAVYGLHPLVALVLFIVDQMLFAGELGTGFLLAILSFFVGLALVVPISLLQRHAYGDPWGPAIAKGMIAGILTSIPTGLPAFVTAGMGILGAVGWQHRPVHRTERRETIETNGFEVKRGPNGNPEE